MDMTERRRMMNSKGYALVLREDSDKGEAEFVLFSPDGNEMERIDAGKDPDISGRRMADCLLMLAGE